MRAAGSGAPGRQPGSEAPHPVLGGSAAEDRTGAGAEGGTKPPVGRGRAQAPRHTPPTVTPFVYCELTAEPPGGRGAGPGCDDRHSTQGLAAAGAATSVTPGPAGAAAIFNT